MTLTQAYLETGTEARTRFSNLLKDIKEEELGKKLISEGFSYKSAPLLTENKVIETAGERMLLCNRTHAEAVDMESAAIVKICKSKNMKSFVVKVVIDDFENDLPNFNEYFSSSGNITPSDVSETLKKPGEKEKIFSKNLKSGRNVLTQIAPLVTSYVECYWSQSC